MNCEYCELAKIDLEDTHEYAKYVKLIYEPIFFQETCDLKDNVCVISALNNLFQNRYEDWPFFRYKDLKKYKENEEANGFTKKEIKKILESQDVIIKDYVWDGWDPLASKRGNKEMKKVLFNKKNFFSQTIGFLIVLSPVGLGEGHLIGGFTDKEGNLVIYEEGLAFVIKDFDNFIELIEKIYEKKFIFKSFLELTDKYFEPLKEKPKGRKK